MEFEGKILNIQKYYVNEHIVGFIDGKLICDCKGYKMSKKLIKECKHIQEVKKLQIFVDDKSKLEQELTNLKIQHSNLIENFLHKHPLIKRIEIQETENNSTFIDIII